MHYTNLRTHSLTHFAETVQPIVVPFGMWTLIGPENRELDGGLAPPRGRDNLEREDISGPILNCGEYPA